MKDKVNMGDLNTVRLRIEAKISETLSKLDKNVCSIHRKTFCIESC